MNTSLDKYFPLCPPEIMDSVFGSEYVNVFSKEFSRKPAEIALDGEEYNCVFTDEFRDKWFNKSRIRYSINSIIFDIPRCVTHFKFIPSNRCEVHYDLDLLTVKYRNGITAEEFAEEYISTFSEQFSCIFGDNFNISVVYPKWLIVPYLKPTKIEIRIISINKYGEFLKLCYEPIQITQLKYKELDKHKFRNQYYNFTFIYAVDGNQSIDDYYDIWESTKVLYNINQIHHLPEGDKLKPIIIDDAYDSQFSEVFGLGKAEGEVNNVFITTTGVHRPKVNRVYLPKSKYIRYRIKSLDYIADFVNVMARKFASYGFELIEYEKLKDASTSNIVLFKINTHAREFLKRTKPFIPDHNIIFSGSTISFTLLTPDTQVYEDFKIRYENIDIIQNQREFVCKDKYGYDWRYDCIWTSKLDESFSHDFPQTDLGTYGYQFQFQAQLEFFDVYDEVYNILTDIEFNLFNDNSDIDKVFDDNYDTEYE